MTETNAGEIDNGLEGKKKKWTFPFLSLPISPPCAPFLIQKKVFLVRGIFHLRKTKTFLDSCHLIRLSPSVQILSPISMCLSPSLPVLSPSPHPSFVCSDVNEVADRGRAVV